MRFILTLLVAGSLQAQTFVTATVAPAAALRGIPPTLRLEIRNSGAEPLRIPKYFSVLAVLPSGEEYAPRANEGLLVLQVPEAYADDPPLAPGAKRVLHVPLGESLGAPEVFADPHFLALGAYSIQLVLDDRQIVGSRNVADPLLVTPPVRFTVVAGSPADARVWEAMMQRTGNQALGARSPRSKRQIATELLAMAGDSGYRAHLILAKSADDNADWIALLREAIPFVEDNPFLADRLQAALIAANEQASLEADVARKLPLAAQWLQSADAALEGFRPETEWGEKRAAQLRRVLRDSRERLNRLRD